MTSNQNFEKDRSEKGTSPIFEIVAEFGIDFGIKIGAEFGAENYYRGRFHIYGAPYPL